MCLVTAVNCALLTLLHIKIDPCLCSDIPLEVCLGASITWHIVGSFSREYLHKAFQRMVPMQQVLSMIPHSLLSVWFQEGTVSSPFSIIFTV